MWQTIIVFVLVLGFKALAAYAQHKKKQQLEIERGRLGKEFLGAPVPVQKPTQDPQRSVVAPAPPRSIEGERGPAGIVGYHTTVHESQGEATATDLAKTVAMIHRGVLERDTPVPADQTSGSGVGKLGAGRVTMTDWRNAVRRGSILGAPRSLNPA